MFIFFFILHLWLTTIHSILMSLFLYIPNSQHSREIYDGTEVGKKKNCNHPSVKIMTWRILFVYLFIKYRIQICVKEWKFCCFLFCLEISRFSFLIEIFLYFVFVQCIRYVLFHGVHNAFIPENNSTKKLKIWDLDKTTTTIRYISENTCVSKHQHIRTHTPTDIFTNK